MKRQTTTTTADLNFEVDFGSNSTIGASLLKFYVDKFKLFIVLIILKEQPPATHKKWQQF